MFLRVSSMFILLGLVLLSYLRFFTHFPLRVFCYFPPPALYRGSLYFQNRFFFARHPFTTAPMLPLFLHVSSIVLLLGLVLLSYLRVSTNFPPRVFFARHSFATAPMLPFVFIFLPCFFFSGFPYYRIFAFGAPGLPWAGTFRRRERHAYEVA